MRCRDMRFNLELKEDRPEIAERVLGVIRDAGRDELTLVTSGEDGLMEKLRSAVRRSGARVALGASTGDVARFALAARDGTHRPSEPMALQIPAHFAGAPLVTPALLAAAHAHGVHVHVWTINDPAEIARAARARRRRRDLGLPRARGARGCRARSA